MNLDIAYAITGFLCAAACVIVGYQIVFSRRQVSREPVALAMLAGVFGAISAFKWNPPLTETLAYAGIGFSLLAAWAAWKDAVAAGNVEQRAKKPN